VIRATAGSILLDCGVRVEQDQTRRDERHTAPRRKRDDHAVPLHSTAPEAPDQDNICTPYLQHSNWPASASALDNLALVSPSYIKLGASCGLSSLPIAREEGGAGDRVACSNPDPYFFLLQQRALRQRVRDNPTKSSILGPPPQLEY
jgi:hypothetical protein